MALFKQLFSKPKETGDIASKIEEEVSVPAVPRPLPENVSGKDRRILIIDDADGIRSLVKDTLSDFDFEVLDAADAETGVQMAADQHPDLILCDISMPEIDGYDTFNLLRKTPSTASIPIMFLTGITDRDTHRKAMELGADDFMTKPFTTSELVNAIHTRIEKIADIKRKQKEQLDELCQNIRTSLPHELCTPLHGIIGLSSYIQEDPGSITPDELQEFANSINSSATRLNRLIENFLTCTQLELISKDTARLTEFRQSSVIEVGSMIGELASVVAKKYQREDDLSCDIGAANVFAPAEYFKRAVEEAIDNAFKFSEAGNPVEVSTSTQFGMFCLEVTNQGRGMTKEQIARIGFHMQFDRETFEQQGMGLGLALVKKFSEMLRGRLLIDSEPDVRTKLSMLLPEKTFRNPEA